MDGADIKRTERVHSFTISLSSTSSILETRFFPPIELSPSKQYALGLIELWTFHSIPNIDSRNNIIVVNNQAVEIPTGSYELEDLENIIKEKIKNKGYSFSLQANNNTLKSEILCSHEINFLGKRSIGRLLGFTSKILEPNVKHISDLPVQILKVNTIRVECNITGGSYVNERRVHVIHEFFPSVPPSYKIIESPSPVIYLPVTVNTIDHIQLRLVDQDGELINFRGETISIRLHIKSIS